jgi:hypothetical protein
MRIALLTLLLMLAMAAFAEETVPPAWTPDPALHKKLVATVQFHGYQMQLPKEYTQTLPPEQKGFSLVAWLGAARKDGSQPCVILLLFDLPESEQKNSTDESVMKESLADKARRTTNFKQTTIERGTLNGRVFLRARWSGVSKTNNKPINGVVYLCREGNSFIQLSSQDLAPYTTTIMPLHETAMRTFRSAPAEKPAP